MKKTSIGLESLKELLIGKKAKGFQFQDTEEGIWWNSIMNDYVGEEGEIVDIREGSLGKFKVDIKFAFSLATHDVWTYPLSGVLKQVEMSQDASNYDVY